MAELGAKRKVVTDAGDALDVNVISGGGGSSFDGGGSNGITTNFQSTPGYGVYSIVFKYDSAFAGNFRLYYQNGFTVTIETITAGSAGEIIFEGVNAFGFQVNRTAGSFDFYWCRKY